MVNLWACSAVGAAKGARSSLMTHHGMGLPFWISLRASQAQQDSSWEGFWFPLEKGFGEEAGLDFFWSVLSLGHACIDFCCSDEKAHPYKGHKLTKLPLPCPNCKEMWCILKRRMSVLFLFYQYKTVHCSLALPLGIAILFWLKLSKKIQPEADAQDGKWQVTGQNMTVISSWKWNLIIGNVR